MRNKKDAIPNDLITAAEASRLVGVSVWTLVTWAKAGRIARYARPGFKRAFSLYSRCEVERMVPVRVN